MIPNYYARLGVVPNASSTEIKGAYRRLARKYHPDKSGGKIEDEQIKRLNEAYAILSDVKKRAAYDELLAQARARELAQREPKMTWVQGMFGFVRELKKGMRDD